jgi:uncharacterized damage-inducible protein DinB
MANTTDPIVSCLERNWNMIESALEGMDDDMLSRAPAAECNSAAWILWHLSRVMDMFIHTRLQDAGQLWTKEGWAEKFSIAPGIEDRGVGWTAEQVAEWTPPSRQLQEGYYHAVKAATQAYLAQVSEDELAREIVLPPLPEPRTIAACFGQVMWDNLAHGGQIAYLHGLFLGMGWHR